jgi:hypothetical protein
MADTKTVMPDDSISCIDLSRPKAPRSDHSKHSERSHRSHRTHHSSRSKHSHRHDGEKTHAPLDTQTVVPDDSISSVGYKTARSEMSHRSEREHKSEHKSHHGSSSRVSKHSKSHDHDTEKEEESIPLDARTVLPEDSISSVGAPARSEHSHRSEREHKSHHGSSSRVSRHSRSHDKHKEEESKVPLDAQTVLPEDSISSVGAPARSEHSRKSHHSSRSKHSSSKSHHRDDKEKKDRAPSEAGKSDVTVKPVKSIFSAMTLPGRLRGGDKKDEEKKKKRSVASFA